MFYRENFGGTKNSRGNNYRRNNRGNCPNKDNRIRKCQQYDNQTGEKTLNTADVEGQLRH